MSFAENTANPAAESGTEIGSAFRFCILYRCIIYLYICILSSFLRSFPFSVAFFCEFTSEHGKPRGTDGAYRVGKRRNRQREGKAKQYHQRGK